MTSSSLDLSTCRSALGMQSEEIPDSSITASSSLDPVRLAPSCGRIRHERMGGAWCPKYQVTSEPSEYLQIDFQHLKVITLVETQGRFDQGQGHEYTEQYTLQYQREDHGSWLEYRNKQQDKILRGNSNTYMVELNELSPPIIARRLRILPISQQTKNVCLRVEVYGCQWTEGVTSYDMKQGDRRGADMELIDRTYDGSVLNKGHHPSARSGSFQSTYLTGGLGQLMDGVLGDSNFRRHHGSKGVEWVGWKRRGGGIEEGGDNDLVEVTFKFDVMRQFKSVSFYCNNAISKVVSVFKSAKVFFSSDGSNYYHVPPVEFSNDEYDLFQSEAEVDQARWMAIPLEGRVARYVKVWLFFGAKWLMISEVRFESDPYNDPLIAHYTAAQKYTRQHLRGNSSNNDEDDDIDDNIDDDDDDVVTRTNEVLYDVIGKESGSRKKDHKSESNRQRERWLVAGSDDRNEFSDESPGGRTKMNFYHSEWNSTESQRADNNGLVVLTAILPVATKMTSEGSRSDMDQSESSTRLKAILAGLLCGTALCALIVVSVFFFSRRRKMESKDFLTPYQSSPLSNKSEAVPSAPSTPPPTILHQERPPTPIYSNDCNSSLSYVVGQSNSNPSGTTLRSTGDEHLSSNTYEDINNFKPFTPVSSDLESDSGSYTRTYNSRLPFEKYSCQNTFQNPCRVDNFMSPTSNTATGGRNSRRSSKSSHKFSDRPTLKGPATLNDDYFLNHVSIRGPSFAKYGLPSGGNFNTFAEGGYGVDIKSIPGIEASNVGHASIEASSR